MVRRSYIITTYGMAYRLQSSAIQLLKCLNVHKALEAATPIVKLRSCVITFNLSIGERENPHSSEVG